MSVKTKENSSDEKRKVTRNSVFTKRSKDGKCKRQMLVDVKVCERERK